MWPFPVAFTACAGWKVECGCGHSHRVTCTIAVPSASCAAYGLGWTGLTLALPGAGEPLGPECGGQSAPECVLIFSGHRLPGCGWMVP